MTPATRFEWTLSYQGETEFSARLCTGRTITLALRWRVPEYEDGGSQSREEHEREMAGAFGIVRDYRNSREAIAPELFAAFCAWYGAQAVYPKIVLSRGYYRAGEGWIKV